MASKIQIGNAVLNLEDLAKLENGKAEVLLDTASLEKVRAFASTSKSKPINADLVETLERTSDVLDCELVRGIMVKIINSILLVRAKVRAEIAEFFASLLNNGIVPMLPVHCTDKERMAQLVVALLGKGFGTTSTNEFILMAELLDTHNIPPLESCSQDEFDFLTVEWECNAAICAKTIRDTQHLTKLADVVGAVTCELLEVSTSTFAASIHEKFRPSQGSQTSAGHLRSLLEGSSRVSPREKKSDHSLISEMPQIHGFVHDEVMDMRRHARSLINSTTGCLEKSYSLQSMNSENILAYYSRLFVALKTIVAASNGRVQLINKCFNAEESVSMSATGSVSAEGQRSPVIVGLELVRSIKKTISQLAFEYNMANDHLIRINNQMVEAAKTKNEARQAAAAKRAEQEAAKETKRLAVLAEKMAKMTLEQKANAEKKEANFQEKRAKKALKKAGNKKSTNGGLVLGNGINASREFIETHATEMNVDGISGVFDPSDVGVHSFVAFLDALFESLSIGGARRKPKIAKGTRDYMPEQMEIREEVFNVIKGVFKLHGAVEIDTPVFERRETLMGKYGEEGGKLIYDLADQGGELLSLRYDLTVPFARFLAMHNPGAIKRFHISRVYRRDNPAMTKGRYREFYQCDYDVAGAYAPMIPDAEVVCVASEILSSLPIGDFKIKVNHRCLLDATLAVCGVSSKKFKTVCSTIDKLDKEPWCDVREELIDEKGVSVEAADMIGEFVKLNGEPEALLQLLVSENRFCDNKLANKALAELELCFRYLKSMGALEHILFDLSLARGLDYYTGLIYEAVLIGGSVGSIAGGGRYDELVGMFSASGTSIPCVGVSIGIERVFAIMEANAKETGGFKTSPVDVLVASTGKNMLEHRMAICSELWKGGIAAEFMYDENPKMAKQMNAALEQDIPYMVIVGETEIAAGTVKLKMLREHKEDEIERDSLVCSIRQNGIGKRSKPIYHGRTL
eukprot:TRINITY_DN1035_c0_g2_i1.p1 TRINITY_DN1035_c0_g2~~TRINITY_DN1035_c0_g2_i1.p1  ORF type:complete len:981 (+),score=238.20 TRINITY_DN1035_c0_g2_i1:32-2944(+)